MAPSGTIVFSSGAGLDFDIWTLCISTGELTQLTRDGNINDSPRWSPDGHSIVYLSTQEDSISSLWLMDEDGRNKCRLTTDLFCQHPSWSPDGREILFIGNPGDGKEMNVCSVPVTGGSPRVIFSLEGLEQSPCWAPDGSRILFSAKRGATGANSRDTEIMVFDCSLSQVATLFSHPAKDYGPVYSPTGDRIAFISHRTENDEEEYARAFKEYREILTHGSNQEARAAMRRMQSFEGDGDIFVANSDGSNLQRLTDDSFMDRGLTWSPCGRYLLYTSSSQPGDGTERLKIIDASTGVRIPFSYDRTALEADLDGERFFNRSFVQKLVPDVIERLLLNRYFMGEERNPHWKR